MQPDRIQLVEGRGARLPESIHDPLVEDWRVWVIRHGGPDPVRIPLGHWVYANDERRTIVVPVTQLDVDGRPRIAGPPDDRYLVTDHVTVQLEAPALPFPSEALADA